MKISILIPFYNEEKYIKDAILSVKNQTYKDFECILIDNLSVDNSKKIAEKTIKDDKRFKIIVEPKRGIENALNKGVSLAQGEYISFLDADDWYVKDRLEIMLDEITKNNVDIVVCKSIIIDERNGKSKEFPFYWFSEKEFPFLLFRENVIRSMSYLMIKKESLKKMIPFPAKYNLLLDYYIAVQSVLKDFKIRFLNKNLVYKRYHTDNMAHNRFASDYQDIGLTDYFLESYPSLEKIYTKKEIKTIFTRKYIRGANYARRKGLFNQIPDYLIDFVEKGFIKKEFYFYFSAISYLKADFKTFSKYIDKTELIHPFVDFFKGIGFFYQKDYKKASMFFKTAFIKSLENFPEAFNSFAISTAYINEKDSKKIFKLLSETFPFYNDGKENFEKLVNFKKDKLKHTIYFTKTTLDYFLYFS